jgi:hypothetical protein
MNKQIQESETPAYKWGALSPNDPSQVPMKYFTQEQAQQHTDSMNKLIDTWEENPVTAVDKDGKEYRLWNKDHWKVKPEPWKVMELK